MEAPSPRVPEGEDNKSLLSAPTAEGGSRASSTSITPAGADKPTSPPPAESSGVRGLFRKSSSNSLFRRGTGQDTELLEVGPGRERSVSHTPAINFPDVVLSLRERIRRKKKVKDLLMYLLFVIMFLVQVLLARDVGASNQVHYALGDLLIAEEFPAESSHILKNYNNIGSVEEFWQWAEGPLSNAIEDAHENNDDLLYQYNRLVGSVRFRQLRVKNDSCPTIGKYKEITNGCFDKYSAGNRDREPFGPEKQYEWRSATKLQTPTDAGRVAYVIYDGGGHAVNLRVDGFRDAVQLLQDHNWVDRQTRAVFVTLNTYNPNIHHFSHLKMVLEFTPGGGIYPWTKFKTFRLDPYLTSLDSFRAAVEVCLILLVFYFISVEVGEYKELVRNGKGRMAYFADPWNILDITNLTIFMIVILLNIIYIADHAQEDFDFESPKYVPLDLAAKDYTELFDLNSFNVLLTFIKMFKFLKVNPRMLLLWKTLGKASPDLLAFFLFFLIVFFGFATMGHLLFGPDLWEFRDFLGSVSSCANMIVGEFDYPALRDVHRILGPMFFLFFILLVYFTLANMLLAIINDAFSVVKRETSDHKNLGQQIRKGLQKKLKKVKTILARKNNKMLSEDEMLIKLTESDLANKDEVSLKEIKGILGPNSTDEEAQKLLKLSQKGTMMRIKMERTLGEGSVDDSEEEASLEKEKGSGSKHWKVAKGVLTDGGKEKARGKGKRMSTDANATTPSPEAAQLLKRVATLETKVDDMMALLRAMGDAMTAKYEEDAKRAASLRTATEDHSDSSGDEGDEPPRPLVGDQQV